MFRQLRNKFITMNMVIISLLFSLAFGLLYTSQASSIKTYNQNTMNQLLDSVSNTNNGERKYEVGVLRAMGMKKKSVILGL